MLWFNKKDDKDTSFEDFQSAVNNATISYESEYDKERKIREAKRASLFRDLDSSEFEFDFAKMKAFSIERISGYDNVLGELCYTVIGYIKPNSDSDDTSCIGEWKLFCSVEEHNKLVNKFRKVNKLGDNDEVVAKTSKKK